MNALPDDADKGPDRFFPAALAVAAAISLVPWFFIQLDQSINADMACLMIAMQRLLAGGTMAADFNYPNPPLCILIYIFPVLAEKFLHIPLYHALFFYSLLLVALSSWAVYTLAKASGAFSRGELRLLTAGYVLCNTVLAGQFLGEREQYILLGLFPFVLAQAGMTWRWPLPRRITLAVLAAGSVAALIKPYFLIVPAALLLHRALRERRWKALLDADGYALIAAGMVYLIVTALFFLDFVRFILPDIISLYLPVNAPLVLPIGVCFGLLCLMLAATAWLLPARPQIISAALFLIAALCMIPFLIQGRGYFYHAFPAMVFFGCGLLLLAHQLSAPVLAKRAPKLLPALPLLIFVIFAALSWSYLPPNADYPTHDEYRKSVFAQEIKKCGGPCPFFMFNDMSEMVSPLAIYTGQAMASRFPSYWFLPRLVLAQYALDHGQPSALTREQVAALREKYAAMVADDFRKYDPELLIIGQFEIAGESGLFDFPAWFSASPSFAREWRRYRFVKDISVNRADFFGGTIYALKDNTVTYKIYRKKAD